MSKSKTGQEKSEAGALEKSTRNKGLPDVDLGESLLLQSFDIVDAAVRRAFELRRTLFVSELVARVRESQLSLGPVAGSTVLAQGEWIEIESLSRLRSVVGGRFHNIKKKWIEAGFPLREHRGDKGGQAKVDEKGWVELSSWILKQGFEARLASQQSEFLFELRSVSKS